MPDLTLRLKGDSSDLVKSIGDVEKSIDKLDDANSFKQIASASIATKAKLEELRATIDALGDQATPELRQEFDRLEKSFTASFAGSKKRVAELTDEIGDTRSAAKALGGDSFDLQDIFQAAFPKMAQNVGMLVSSIGAAGTALESLGRAIDFVRKEFEPLNSAIAEQLGLSKEAATALGAALTDLTSPLDLIQGKSEAWTIALKKAREDWGFLIGQTEAAANAHEKLVKFTKAHEEALKKAGEEQKKLNEELQKATLGFSFKEIQDEIAGVQKSFELLQSLGIEKTGKAADALRERVALLDEKLKILGTSVEQVATPEALEALRLLREEMDVFGISADEGAKKTLELAEATGKTVKELQQQARALRDVRAEIDGVGADVLHITGDIRTLFAENVARGAEGIDALTAKIAALNAEEQRLSRQFNISEESELRRQEIAAERADLERELIKAQREGGGQVELSLKDQIAIQTKFRDALAAAEKQIKDWPESAKGAMQAVIDRFQFMNDEVNVSQRDVEEFETAFKGAMAAAGAATTALETKLQKDLREAKEAYRDFAEEAVSAYSLINEEAAKFSAELRSQIELAKQLATELDKLDKEEGGAGVAVN